LLNCHFTGFALCCHTGLACFLEFISAYRQLSTYFDAAYVIAATPLVTPSSSCAYSSRQLRCKKILCPYEEQLLPLFGTYGALLIK
jgi:hypothetical protein